jgi:hypothetical protein
LSELAQGLHLAEVLLGHPLLPVGLGDEAATHEHGEQCDIVILHREPHFVPHVHILGHGKVKVGIDAMPGFNMDDHTTQNRHFHARAPWEPDVKKWFHMSKWGSIPMKASLRVRKAMISKILEGA